MSTALPEAQDALQSGLRGPQRLPPCYVRSSSAGPAPASSAAALLAIVFSRPQSRVRAAELFAFLERRRRSFPPWTILRELLILQPTPAFLLPPEGGTQQRSPAAALGIARGRARKPGHRQGVRHQRGGLFGAHAQLMAELTGGEPTAEGLDQLSVGGIHPQPQLEGLRAGVGPDCPGLVPQVPLEFPSDGLDRIRDEAMLPLQGQAKAPGVCVLDCRATLRQAPSVKSHASKRPCEGSGDENQEAVMQFSPADTAVVVTDPQVDFLSPQGVTWELVGDSVQENHTIEHLGRLLQAALDSGYGVFVSPHYYYPYDRRWEFGGALEQKMHEIGMFQRNDPLDLTGFEGSGADWLADFKPLFEDGRAVVCSPHKVYGPQNNDLALQLRKRGVSKVVLAGMTANLCVESHLRDLLEDGFEVAVVADATAAARHPELGDGMAAALTNFKYLAAEVLSTDEAVGRL